MMTDLRLTLSLYAKVEVASCAFIWEDFMDFAEDFGAQVNTFYA